MKWKEGLTIYKNSWKWEPVALKITYTLLFPVLYPGICFFLGIMRKTKEG